MDEIEELLDPVGGGPVEPEGDVRPHVEMREQRPVLEDEADAAPFRRRPVALAGDAPPTDLDGSGVGAFEPGDHAEGRGLAAAARAEQRHDLAVPDVEIERVDGAHAAEGLRDAAGGEDGCVVVHRGTSSVAPRRPASAHSGSDATTISSSAGTAARL